MDSAAAAAGLPSSLCHLERLCLDGRTCIMPEALLAHLPRVDTLRAIEFKVPATSCHTTTTLHSPG